MRKTILVVEDEKPLSDAIKRKLEKQGHTVIQALRAEDAIEILKLKKPDFIWLDFLLPGMNGMEFLEKIKSEKDTSSVPVVMVSVSGGSDNIEKALSLGASDYIVKSQFPLDKIIEKVGLFLK